MATLIGNTGIQDSSMAPQAPTSPRLTTMIPAGIGATPSGIASASLEQSTPKDEDLYATIRGWTSSVLDTVRPPSSVPVSASTVELSVPAATSTDSSAEPASIDVAEQREFPQLSTQDRLERRLKEQLKSLDQGTQEYLVLKAAGLLRPIILSLMQQLPATSSSTDVAQLNESTPVEELLQWLYLMTQGDTATQERIKNQMHPAFLSHLLRLIGHELVTREKKLPKLLACLLHILDPVSGSTSPTRQFTLATALTGASTPPISKVAAGRRLAQQLRRLDLNTQGRVCLQAISLAQPIVATPPATATSTGTVTQQLQLNTATPMELMQHMLQGDKAAQERMLPIFLPKLQTLVEEELLIQDHPLELTLMQLYSLLNEEKERKGH